MNFVGGALPNVMFLIGVMAIGIGLGLEFKIVEIKGQLSRGARFGAMGVGAALIGLSIVLYLKPDVSSASAVPSNTPVVHAIAAPAQTTRPAADGVAEPTTVPEQPTAPAPTAEPAQAAVPVQAVSVPDIQGQNTRDAERLLAAAGLRLGEQQGDCVILGATATKAPKGKVSCQRPGPGTLVAPGASIDYVLADKGAKD